MTEAFEVVVAAIIKGIFESFIHFWYLALLLILIAVIRIFKPKIKGFFGEKVVAICLSKLDKRKYKVINDVLISMKSGKTSQIDHVVVSIYGIFVIETKNYKGWIFGQENSNQWTQVIYNRKENFLNPVRQNKGHVQALQELLSDFPSNIYIPIVTFGVKATLKEVNVDSEVVYTPKLVKTIHKYKKKVLSVEDMEDIYSRIAFANRTDKKARKAHVQGIKESMRSKPAKIKKNLCPQCGGKLVDRKGRYGPFSGCSNYPRCRFAQKKG